MTEAQGRLAGKIAIITGGAQGMGAAHARMFVAQGAKVMITDVAEEGAALAQELGENARFLRHDVSKASDWQAVVAATESAFGPVSVLINNAGIFFMKSIEETSEEEYRRIIGINQVGCFLGMKTVLPSMRRASGGSIINVSSVSGLAGAPGQAGYVSSKFAIRGLTKVAALEFGRDNIRVNSVHPGAISTPMTAGARPPAAQPIQRLGRPEEAALLMVYLASDESSYSTGAEFTIDGGYMNLVGEIVI